MLWTLIFCLAATSSAGEDPSPIGNEPKPMVLELGAGELVRRFQPLDPATFGEKGLRQLDYQFEPVDLPGLARRKVDDEPAGQVIPLGLGTALADGRPCVVLEMVLTPGQPTISKGSGFSLRLKAVVPDKLRESYGPGVYEGLAWLRFLPRDPDDPLKGARKHLLRLRLVIPGRRVARLAVTGRCAVGRRVKVEAAVEEVLPGSKDPATATATTAAPQVDLLRVEIVPEGESVATLALPWPVPTGAWDPREPGANGERAGWAVPQAWLDEPILVDDPGSNVERVVDDGPARSIVHRQALRLPPLFAPGTLKASLAPSGSTAATTAEIPVRSGLIAGPALAFLNDPLNVRALLARGENPGGGDSLPDQIKVRVDPPSGQGKTFTLAREARTTGYASYTLKAKEQPKLLAPGLYKVAPATGDAELDRVLGGEVVVLAGLEKDDAALRRERVAFLGTTPFHWPLIVWLDSGKKDGATRKAETRRALALKSVRGVEEIGELSLSLSQIAAPARQRPHANEKDGEVRFTGPGKSPRGPWSFDRQGIDLDLTADLEGTYRKPPPPAKGPRERSARFLIVGVGLDKEKIGRIFREPCNYLIASHWDYYLEWGWTLGLIVAALAFILYVRGRRGTKGKSAKSRFGRISPKIRPEASTRGGGKPQTKAAGPENRPGPGGEPTRRVNPKDPGKPRDGGKGGFRR